MAVNTTGQSPVALSLQRPRGSPVPLGPRTNPALSLLGPEDTPAAPLLPCRKASQHRPRLLSPARSPSGAHPEHPDNKVVLAHLPGVISRLSVVTRKAQGVKQLQQGAGKLVPATGSVPWPSACGGGQSQAWCPGQEHGAPLSCPTSIQTHN